MLFQSGPRRARKRNKAQGMLGGSQGANDEAYRDWPRLAVLDAIDISKIPSDTNSRKGSCEWVDSLFPVYATLRHGHTLAIRETENRKEISTVNKNVIRCNRQRRLECNPKANAPPCESYDIGKSFTRRVHWYIDPTCTYISASLGTPAHISTYGGSTLVFTGCMRQSRGY